ncbi:MAG: response regulator [Planctomycetota bacterium]
MRALIADDSGVIRCVVSRALTELGFAEVLAAVDGREAIAALDGRAFDIIITDWNMPNHSGLDVIKAARTAGYQCPIVMQTTESEKAYVMQAIAAGVNDYILKPFNKEQLIEKLEKHVRAIATT